MSLPGFTADATLGKTFELYSMNEAGVGEAKTSQFAVNPTAALGTPGLTGCIDIDHLPVCRGGTVTPFGRCCDTTHERVCNGQRVAICTFTDCTKRTDTNASFFR